MSKTGTFHLISDFTVISVIYFLTDFDASKSVSVSFFAFFTKIWPNMYRRSKSRFCFWLTYFSWWPEMTLTCIMVTKHRKWYLQMSVTLSIPIHWPCLRLTSKFYSPMSPSPKGRKYLLWPDLWRHQWPPGQKSHYDVIRSPYVFLPITFERNELETELELVPQCSSPQGASTDMQHDLLRSHCDLDLA